MKRLFNLLGLPVRKAPKVGTTPADVAWAENKWKLLRYRHRPEGLAHRTPVLLVPSLINRHYVLDLLPGTSFAEFLVQQGFDVFCLDWGTPTAEDRFMTFADVVDGVIGRALRRVAAEGSAEKAHVLGYCMGGTLATIHGALYPERVASFIGLAAPVRFHDESLLSKWTNSKGYNVDQLIDTYGNAPWPILQATFHMLRPTLTALKLVTLVDRAADDDFVDGFLAMEKWSNDNVSIPGEFFRSYIKELYQADGLVRGGLFVRGRRVQLSNIRYPTLAVTFQHDTIVPAESSRLLLDLVSSTEKRHLHLPGTHVGAVVTKPAAKHLWPALAAFFAQHDAAGHTKRSPAMVGMAPATEASPPVALERTAPPVATEKPAPGLSPKAAPPVADAPASAQAPQTSKAPRANTELRAPGAPRAPRRLPRAKPTAAKANGAGPSPGAQLPS